VTYWIFGLRGLGVFFAVIMGGLILRKMRHYRDPALWWLFVGLSFGPALVLVWNAIFRVYISDFVSPIDRLPWLGNFQMRFVYEIINSSLNLLCAGCAFLGVARLYLHVKERIRPIPPAQFVSNDPRN
jgi:hypothetical protein